MNIVLIGMRGSGKSTVGKILAEKMGYGFKETDAMVEARIRRPIAVLVQEQGWEAFRDEETRTVTDAVADDHQVISTGGGVVIRRENLERLKSNGFVVFLCVPMQDLIMRVKQDWKGRPLITDAATIEEDMARVWHEREELYHRAADITLDVTAKDVDTIVQKIIDAFTSRLRIA